MKRVLVGHRGVGKTNLLKRHAIYFSGVVHFDLDEEIEKHSKMTVAEYFQKYGESHFRKIEIEVWQKLIKENPAYVIALGAGFDISVLALDIEIIYVSRVTDQHGRIFLNRPRLDMSLSRLEEYKKLFAVRNPKFLKSANIIYHMPEGVVQTNAIEKMILTDSFLIPDAYYTLSVQDLNRVSTLIKLYKNIELRTDLLSGQIIQDLLNQFPHFNWLVSIRNAEGLAVRGTHSIDIDYQYYFKDAYKDCQIVSTHSDSIDSGIKQLGEVIDNTTIKLHLKLCPLVESFVDLVKGYRWQQADPLNRSFLPRSTTGKWSWYRQLAKYWQKINFVRNFAGIQDQFTDQPSVFEWLTLPEKKPKKWGAVLGCPIYFSRSPSLQQEYFSAFDMFFTRLEINSEDFTDRIKFLMDLGLSYMAITSPLKECALSVAHVKTEVAQQFKTVNTLYVTEQQKIIGHNTDFAGFVELVKSIKPTDKVAIWGGGGTLAMMKSVLPTAHLYSSQTGQLRGQADAALNISQIYDYLIWAARSTQSQWPPENLKTKTVIDLNYTEDAAALEFAAQRKISYTSGIEMLKLQALKQQEFWSLNLESLESLESDGRK